MPTPIRVGIIGVGWGAIVQTPAFRCVPEYEVAALCSRRPERVAQAGEQLGIADTSTDWREFVRRDDLDLISICTPTDLHHEQAIAAFEAGKNVLCEKPLALNEGQGLEMVQAAEASGKANAVCFENRWGREKLIAWDMVREGYLGQPFFARVTMAAEYWHPSRSLQSEWMYRLDQGGGYLLGLASHDLDYACCLFGEPEAVCADVRTSVPRRKRPDGTELEVDADDTSTVILRMRSGVSALVSTSVVGLHTRDSYRLEAFGSDGTVMIDGTLFSSELRAGRVGDEGLSIVPGSTRMPRSGIEIPKRKAAAAIRALALMLEDWLPAFDGKSVPRVPSIRDAWIVQQIIDGARQSSAGAGWVQIKSS
jgi:predicted dehydrogenase